VLTKGGMVISTVDVFAGILGEHDIYLLFVKQSDLEIQKPRGGSYTVSIKSEEFKLLL
jgi:hypothetical protein